MVWLSRITVVDFEIDPSKDSLTFNLDYRHIWWENTFNALIQSVQCVIFETLNTGSVKLKSHSLSQEVNADIVDILRGIAREKWYKFIEMPSSPGHDAAMLWKVGIRIGMIFVPHNGVSHNPREHLEANNFPKPMEVFADGIEALANR